MKQDGRSQPRTPYTTEYRNKRGLTQQLRDKEERLRRVELADRGSEAASSGIVIGEGYALIQDEGIDLPPQTIIDFVGAGVTATDGGDRTIITIPGGSSTGYDTVEDEGTPLTQRTTMNFVGAGVSAADSGGVTTVTIPGGGSGSLELVREDITIASGAITIADDTSWVVLTPESGLTDDLTTINSNDADGRLLLVTSAIGADTLIPSTSGNVYGGSQGSGAAPVWLRYDGDSTRWQPVAHPDVDSLYGAAAASPQMGGRSIRDIQQETYNTASFITPAEVISGELEIGIRLIKAIGEGGVNDDVVTLSVAPGSLSDDKNSTLVGAEILHGYIYSGAGGDLTFKNGADNIVCATGADIVLEDGSLDYIEYVYDPVSTDWTVWLISATGTGGPPSGAAGGDLSGTYPNPTVKQSSVAFAWAGSITPAAIAADADNYNPTGLSSANHIYQDVTGGDWDINGLAGGAAGRFIVWHNTSAANTLAFGNEQLSSTAANRFRTPNGLNFIVAIGGTVLLFYDTAISRWRVWPDYLAYINDAVNDAVGTLSNPNYLVGTTTSGDLPNEIVVGTTPGGELGGTWAAPTVDTTHSGSAHHNAITIGADGEHSLATQVLSGVDAASGQKGHIRLTNHLGGTAASPTVVGMQETGGPTSLITGAIADGQFLKRVGATIVGAAAGASPLTTKGDLYTFTTVDARLGVGSNFAVLQPDTGAATGLIWRTTPQIATIADTSANTRITLAAATPHVLLTGDVQATGGLYPNSTVPAGAEFLYLVGEELLAVNVTGKAGLGVFMGSSAPTIANTSQIGITGRSYIIGTGVTGTNAGLSFEIGASSPGTLTNAKSVGVQISSIFASSTNLTVTDLIAFEWLAPTVVSSAALALSNFTGVYIRGSSSTRFTGSVIGFRLDSFSGANVTTYRPIRADGPASTSDNFGSVHRNSFMIGSLTAAFGTGDGVLGLANRTTAPSTTPASGIVLFAADAQRLMMRGVYAVNEPLHTTLVALAAGSAYANSTTETALNNAVFNFPANSLVADAVYRVTARGVYSDTLTPTFQLRVRWGGVAGVLLGDSGAVTMGVSQTNVGWHVEFLIRVVSIGATGTVEAQGNFAANTTAVLATFDHMANAAVITIDTTAAKDLVLTGQWSAASASNTLTCRQFVVERIA